MLRPETGRILVDGRDVAGLDPAGLRRFGVAHVPEDRHGMGLVLPFEENENAILGYHGDAHYAVGPFLDLSAIRADAKAKIDEYDVQPPNCRLKTSKFSGGNQQKIVLAREIERDPGVAARRPADARRGHRGDRVHPQAAGRPARRRQGDPAGLGRARRDHGARRPHPGHVRRPHHGRAVARARPISSDLGLLMAGVTDRAA